MKKFLKQADVQLVNGGYLSDKNEVPVTNEQFVAAQKHAEYVVTFAQLAKGKNFEGKKADTLEDLRKEVAKALAAKQTVFVTAPAKIERELTEKLKQEAMAFINYSSEVDKVEKINAFLQQFTVLQEFKEFGLFFEDGIVKLNKIYTMDEVISAVKEVIDLLK